MFCNYRVILSIDGCGFKGVIPLKILDYLYKEISICVPTADPVSTVDLFTSSSISTIFTGALMLTDKQNNRLYTPKLLLDFYRKKGKTIFSKNEKFDSENDVHPYHFVLEHFFGNIKLKDIKKHFLFFSYNINNDSIYSFSKQNYRLYELSLAKMMQACTVNDLIYPPVSISGHEHCDVSSFLVNPSCLGYNYLKVLYPNDFIILLSIGFKNNLNGNKNHFFQQKEEVHNEMCSIEKNDHLLKYFRFQPDISNLDINPETFQENEKKIDDFVAEYMKSSQNQIEQMLDLVSLKHA
ncbi:MAG: hypothetical protein HYU67_00055 [Flavobacteriia bacterium]|nr:hypothetical protein [Flavobacteriia bacterium]